MRLPTNAWTRSSSVRASRFGDRNSEQVGQRHGRHGQRQAGGVEQRARQVERSGSRVPYVLAAVEPPRGAAEAVEADRAEHDRDEGDRSRRRRQARQADERGAQNELSLPVVTGLYGEGRDVGEQAEVHAEGLRVREPGFPAEPRGAEPLHEAVQDDRGAERARVGRIEVGELERGEEKELDGGGPPAPVLGVPSHRLGGGAELLRRSTRHRRRPPSTG